MDRHEARRRPETHDAAEGGREPERASQVGPQGEGAEPESEGGGAAARGAAAGQRETDAAGAWPVADAASSTERARKVDPATAAGIAMIAPKGTMKQSCVAMPNP